MEKRKRRSRPAQRGDQLVDLGGQQLVFVVGEALALLCKGLHAGGIQCAALHLRGHVPARRTRLDVLVQCHQLRPHLRAGGVRVAGGLAGVKGHEGRRCNVLLLTCLELLE